MNKPELIQKIKQLEGITQDERAYLIELVNSKKKYGLVWEDKPEEVEEQLRTHIPVLREVVEKRILGKDLPSEEIKSQPVEPTLFGETDHQEHSDNQLNQDSDNYPNHILIEGDNLHALTALTFTHEGKIDVIYIDPPYNTGNKDFKYNDRYVDKEDNYRHSKWLSFMDKRLRIAKTLLSEKGVIFISIDVNEIAQLKILCDEIFLGDRFVNLVANINNPKGRSDEKNIATAHEYILCYSMGNIDFLGWKAGNNILKRYNKVDSQGAIYREIDLRKTGDNDKREDRPNLYYYFLFNPNTKDFYPTTDDYIPIGYIQIKPLRTDMSEGNWRWALETSIQNINRLIPKFMGVRKKYTVFEKDMLVEEDKIKATTVWNHKEVNSERGTEQFLDLGFEKKQFPKPKPIGLLKLILELIPLKNATVLDFFAGSGTTLQATMLINEEDGEKRRCILLTNNENNICEEVTYERNRRVIQGYTNSKAEWVKGLTNNNLRYYKSEFVSRESNLRNKRELTKLATEMLCIKEDCYEEKKPDFIENKEIRYFEENGKRMLVVYDDLAIESAVEVIKSIVEKNPVTENGIKVYVFSPGQYPFTEEFEDVLKYVTLCALPDAIYKAYMNVLPKKSKPSVPVSEDEEENATEPELFEINEP